MFKQKMSKEKEDELLEKFDFDKSEFQVVSHRKNERYAGKEIKKDESGSPVLDEDGQPIPVLDEDGNEIPIILKSEKITVVSAKLSNVIINVK